MYPGVASDPASVRAWESPPDPERVQRVVSWFQQQGFETGPFVGISFAITGSDELFRSVLGEPLMHDDESGDFPLEGLAPEMSSLVAAVTITGPPEFGPGNP